MSWGRWPSFLSDWTRPRSWRVIAILMRCGTGGLPSSMSACARPACRCRVANLSSVWTVCYLQPSRYHWMFQYYLRAENLALSWVGTGTAHLQPGLHGCGLCRGRRPVCRGGAANAAGWLVVGGHALTTKPIRRRVLLEMFRARSHRPSDRSTGPAAGTAATDSKA